jgi:regulator of sigma E protease
MIFFHELGHFLVAKRTGVRVHAFALGFGPQVFGWRRGETTYSLNLLPFGGYVRMEGEDNEGPIAEGSFRAKSVGQRLAIIAAGPVMNLLLAVVILAIAAATGGIPQGPGTKVASLESGWPAVEAGLRVGDEIVAINGQPMTSGEEIIQTVHKSAGKPITLEVRRGTETLTIAVTPRLDPRQGVGRIGFSPDQRWMRVNPVAALIWGVQQTGQFIATLPGAIAMLVREGQFLQNLGGPVAAGRQLAQAARSGAQAFLLTAAYLSVIIGIFNLLPIPALDGGRLAFLLAEGVRRRPVLDARREGLIHQVGFVLLLLLLGWLTVRDVRAP